MLSEKTILNLFDKYAKYIPLPVIVALFTYAASVFVVAKINNIEDTAQLFFINALYFCLIAIVATTVCYYVFMSQIRKFNLRKRYEKNTFYISVFPFEKGENIDIDYSTRIFEKLKDLQREKDYNVSVVDETKNLYNRITSISKAKKFLDYAGTDMVIFGRIISINNESDTEIYPECVSRFDLQEFDSRPANDKEKILDDLEKYIEDIKDKLGIKEIEDDSSNLDNSIELKSNLVLLKKKMAAALIISLMFISIMGFAFDVFEQNSWKPKSEIYTFKFFDLITEKTIPKTCLKYKKMDIDLDFSDPYYSKKSAKFITLDLTEKDNELCEFEASADLYLKKIFTNTPAIDFKGKIKKINLEPNFIEIMKRDSDDEDAKQLLDSVLTLFDENAIIMIYEDDQYMERWIGDTIKWKFRSGFPYTKFNVRPNVEIERVNDKITKMHVQVEINYN